MYKNAATGYYEHDWRRALVPRLHLSYGVTRKAEAEELHALVAQLFREKRVTLIEHLRAERVSVHELRHRLLSGEPLERIEASAPAVAPWPTLQAACDLYLAWLTTNPTKSRGTAETAAVQLRKFVAFAGAATRLDAITSDRSKAFQDALYAAGGATNTITGMLARVGALFAWHRRREEKRARDEKREPRVLHVPIDREEISTKATRRDRFLSPAEADLIVAACPDRLRFPVMAGLLAGLRVGETLHLRPGFDVDLDANLLTIQEQPTWRPKSGKRRFVPIAPGLRPVLEHHLATYASAEWVTPSRRFPDRPFSEDTFDNAFKAIVERAGLVGGRRDPRGVVYHTLRHTFASWLVQRGVDLYAVSQILGNSIRMIEQVYAHLAPEFKQNAISKLDGVLSAPALAP